jgi:hypothetical protein
MLTMSSRFLDTTAGSLTTLSTPVQPLLLPIASAPPILRQAEQLYRTTSDATITGNPPYGPRKARQGPHRHIGCAGAWATENIRYRASTPVRSWIMGWMDESTG